MLISPRPVDFDKTGHFQLPDHPVYRRSGITQNVSDVLLRGVAGLVAISQRSHVTVHGNAECPHLRRIVSDNGFLHPEPLAFHNAPNLCLVISLHCFLIELLAPNLLADSLDKRNERVP